MTSLPQARRFDWANFGIRAASAAVLIPAVLLTVWFSRPLFLVMMAIATAILSLEWGKMSASRAPIRVAAVVTVAVLAVGFLAYLHHQVWAAVALAVGAVAAALLARGVSERPGDAAYGVIYLSPAMYSLIWLHGVPDGNKWVVMAFFITWAADSAAFATGSVLKGPKLWPRLSPNKTWSGFFGGLLGAMATAVAFVLLFQVQLTWWGAALVGLFGGLATMAGDLWESLLKRRFGVKDSGDLIPGHGGLLDRVDGLMFAVVVVAITRLAHDFGLTHLWGLS